MYIAEQEPDNSVDEFAMKLVKSNEQLAIYLANTREFVVLYRTSRKDTRDSDWLQTFICSSKAKINRLKELLKSKTRW